MKRKFLKTFFRHVFFLLYLGGLGSVVCLVRPLAAAGQQRARLGEIRTFMKQVVPSFENRPWQETFVFDGKEIFPCWQQVLEDESPENAVRPGGPGPSDRFFYRKHLSGFAWAVRGAGLARNLEILVGVNSKGKLTGWRILGSPHSRDGGTNSFWVPWGTAAAVRTAEKFFSENTAAILRTAEERISPVRIEAGKTEGHPA